MSIDRDYQVISSYWEDHEDLVSDKLSELEDAGYESINASYAYPVIVDGELWYTTTIISYMND
jgi:hypothetical protein